jgi:uncharacterized protein RhaS with RHS repeats
MKSLLDKGFIGMDMPPLPDDLWKGIRLLPLTEFFVYSTSSETYATWSIPDNEPITTQGENRCNGIIRWYDPITGRWLSNDPIGISGGLNQYVFCSNNPVNFRDTFGLCTEIKNALDTMRQHYQDSLNQSFWSKFFNSQDIKEVYQYQNVVFQDQGGLISNGSMGNQAVGYTAYRTYGYLGAVAISVAGEFRYPDLGNPWNGMQGSFSDNALGIAQGMIDEQNASQGH